jgi:lysophospholipase L1-like esterase
VRRGIATLLVEGVIAQTRYTDFELEVTAVNTPAHDSHRKIGFVDGTLSRGQIQPSIVANPTHEASLALYLAASNPCRQLLTQLQRIRLGGVMDRGARTQLASASPDETDARHRHRGGAVVRTSVRIVALLSLAAGVVAFSFMALHRDDVPPPVSSQNHGATSTAPPLFDEGQSMLIIGDSYVGGVGDPEIEKYYPQILAEELGFEYSIDAAGARGFTPNDLSDIGIPQVVAPYVDRLQYDKDNIKADYIVVDGGRNDLGKAPAETISAFDNYMKKLRAAYPNAKIVVVLPTYMSAKAASLYPFLAPAMTESAEKVGGYVLDPVAERWYSDIDLKPLLWQDGFHPNARGNEYIAQKIADGMRRLGVVKPRPSTG